MSSSSSPAPFTSELTASELLLTGDGGWVPVAMVHGDCSYDPGNQVTSWKYSQKLTRLTEGLTRGQALALERMRQQAAAVGADGVIGGQLTRTDIDLAGEPHSHLTHHFSAVGTAVRRTDGPHETSSPFTSHLCGQDIWALTKAGCTPLGLVFGFGVHHVKTVLRRPDRCTEMPDLTRAVYDARKHAVGDMQAQASALKASGVVGVNIELKITAGPTVTFAATGTAIRTPPAGIHGPDPEIRIRLNDWPASHE